MEITSLYLKQRRDFGRPVNHFTMMEPQTVWDVPPKEGHRDMNYIERNPTILEVSAIPEQSEHEVSCIAQQLPAGCNDGGAHPRRQSLAWQVNTERFAYNSVGTLHTEGGWPKDVDATEKEHTTCERTAQLLSTSTSTSTTPAC